MSDINLLPEDERRKELKEREIAKHFEKKTEVVLTNPPPTPKRQAPNALPKVKWWRGLFGSTKPAATNASQLPATFTGGARVQSPSLLSKGSMSVSPSAMSARSSVVPKKPSFWSRLFSGSAHTPPAARPTPPPTPQKTVVETVLDGPQLLPSTPAPKEQAKPPESFAPRVEKGSLFVHPPQPPAPPVPPKPSLLPTSAKPQATEPPKSIVSSPSISLLPDEYQRVDEQALANFIMTLIATVLISSSVIAFSDIILDQTLRVTNQNDLEKAQQQTTPLISAIADLKLATVDVPWSPKGASIQEQGEFYHTRIELVKKLLDQHRYWTRPLRLIECTADPEVFWDSFIMKDATTVELKGHASTLEAVARQLVIFRNKEKYPQISSVVITGAQAGDVLEQGEPGSTDTSFDPAQLYPLMFDANLKIDSSLVLLSREQAVEERALLSSSLTQTREQFCQALFGTLKKEQQTKALVPSYR